ncbi:hypothetical protein [Paenibacillus radicis (ex Gao et al. 2016)]|uniref:Uncharacterized protein n=1 Tax=Paenibacillus radicis (ex Gao et al. 2016) TaxID=1737354 RepID=A0A917HR62_9BACL|nr:hypothetical protein [Paenibacillus radicis (ex Gao et al. 2016)]GGG86899.1 hypothetical protein GCM10010918_51410 [Paenibacillus radicis (ex Gao et al. 2016)]
MKAWRVGSLSMGVTLLLLGAAIAVSIWNGTDSVNLLLWVAPVVFILLGTELLLYLWLAGTERTVMRYDWMSVFFVSVLGVGAVAMVSLTSTGLLGEFRQSLQITERTAVVKTDAVKVPDTVKKIIVQSFEQVQLDKAEVQDVRLLGQVQYWAVEPMKQPESIISTDTVGSTMYVMIGSFQQKNRGIVSESYHPKLTLVLPQGIEVEERGF